MAELTQKDIIERLLDEAWKNRDGSAYDRYCAPDCEFYDPLQRLVDPIAFAAGSGDVTEYRFLMRRFDESFEILDFPIHELVMGEDAAFVRWSIKVRMRGPIVGLASTGKEGSTEGTALFRFRQGRIIEHRTMWDVLRLLQECEVVPAIEPPSHMLGPTEKKSFKSPDDVRTPSKTRVEAIDLHGTRIGRVRLEPGWNWSEAIKPIAKTERCEAAHRGYALSGRLHVSAKDGSELEIEAGDAYVLQPGHLAWVVGNEPFVALEFETRTVEEYARPAQPPAEEEAVSTLH